MMSLAPRISGLRELLASGEDGTPQSMERVKKTVRKPLWAFLGILIVALVLVVVVSLLAPPLAEAAGLSPPSTECLAWLFILLSYGGLIIGELIFKTARTNGRRGEAH